MCVNENNYIPLGTFRHLLLRDIHIKATDGSDYQLIIRPICCLLNP